MGLSGAEATAFVVAALAVTGVLRPGEVYPGATIMLLAGLLVYGVYATREHLQTSPGFLPLAVIVLAASAASILVNRESDAWRRPTGLLVCGAIAFTAGLQLGPRLRLWLLFLLWGIGLLVIVHGGSQLFGGFGELADRIRVDPGLSAGERELYLTRVALSRPFGPFSLPALLGAFAAFLAALFCSIAADRRLGLASRAGCLTIGLLAATLLLMTRSIGAAASLASAVACLCVIKKRRLLLPLVLLLVACLGLLLVVGSRRHEGSGRGPTTLRLLNYQAAVAMARHHPVFGVGVGGFAYAYPRFRPALANNTKHAHSFPMRQLAETGIPGGLAVLVLYALVAFRLVLQLGTDVPLDRSYALGALVLVIHSMVDIDMDVESFALLTPLMVGVALAPSASWRFGRAPFRLLTAGGLIVSLWFVLAAATGRLLVDRAAEAARSGERGRALHLLKAATRYDHRSTTAWMLQAEESLGRGRLDAALRSLRIAAGLSPGRGRVRKDLAVTLARMGRIQEALREIAAAGRLLPGDSEIKRVEERLSGVRR